MSGPGRSSRRRFVEYKRRRRDAGQSQTPVHVATHGDRAPTPKRPRRRRTFAGLFAAFWALLAGHRATIVLALCTLTVATGLGLLLPISTKIAIDYILTDSPGPDGIPPPFEFLRDAERTRLLWILAGAMIAVTGASVLFAIWGRWQTTRITKRVQVSLRRRVFEHASRLPLPRVQSIRSGGVSSLLREDAGGVGELVFSMIYNPWRAVVQLTGTLAILAVADWRLLVGALMLLPLIWTSHRTWIARIRPMYRDIRATRQAIDAGSAEAFGGMRVVRGFNRLHAEAARFTRDNHYMARQEINTWWWSRGLEIAWQILIPLASVAVLLYGGARVLQGTLTIGDVMMFSAYLLMLLGPLESLVTSATTVQNNLAGLDRVLDLLEEPREFESAPGERAPAGLVLDRRAVAGRVTFENVTFAYPPGRTPRGPRADTAQPTRTDDAPPVPPEPVLHDINLDVAPGEVVALVGPSGAGKTTLCNLVARFYDPSQGRVTLDGRDLRDIHIDSYRSLLGIVEQDVFLFDGSVADNIAYAKRHATREDVLTAAAAAHADRFIEDLEHGYDTLIGERGVRLSGGQKQRLAIARAVLADPRILILDEATSNLDSESERLIQHSLAALMDGRTAFVIAHRLSTVRHADRIVVLDQGRIVEQGTHDELVHSGGLYARFLALQLDQDARSPTPANPPDLSGADTR